MKTAIILGTFDGIHSGHRAVIEKAQGFYSVAVTFDIPPKSFFSGDKQLLMTPDDRKERLISLGVDEVEMQRFEDVKDIDANDYLMALKQKYNPQRIISGFNYRFGRGAVGDTALIGDFCTANNIEYICVDPILKDGEVLSSTYIRTLIREGNIDEATKQIYGGFGFTAPIIHGDARGRTFGFPTANQEYPSLLVKPKFGVYISRVTIDGQAYKAITNIGIRPTYRTDWVGCETFIKDFSKDIYEKLMTTELLQFVREEKRFLSSEELKNAIINDIKLLD